MRCEQCTAVWWKMGPYAKFPSTLLPSLKNVEGLGLAPGTWKTGLDLSVPDDTALRAWGGARCRSSD